MQNRAGYDVGEDDEEHGDQRGAERRRASANAHRRARRREVAFAVVDRYGALNRVRHPYGRKGLEAAQACDANGVEPVVGRTQASAENRLKHEPDGSPR